ncbi:uncharacterized protein LOC126681356 [Mercurialis annua]|uniref:uncharacterized protein LOC126681356 n=1 Tax=Mercurialis annua TaxID=3986 RepID=UPI00215F784D|nr:uncharacterized protein LOC126681356 [Mercurialis annua]
MGDNDSKKQQLAVDVEDDGSGGVVAVIEPTSLKRKVDDEDEVEDKDDGDKEDDGYDDEIEREFDRWSSGLGDYEGSEQQEKDFQKYVDECAASDCFDVEVIPKGKNFIGMLVRIKVDDDQDFFAQHCKETIQIVLDKQNKEKGTDLELVKLIKANREGNAFYYATFEGRNKTSGELNIYQMSVFRCMVDGDDIEIEHFRLKGTGGRQVVQTQVKS